jgi:hypothetical protein
VCLRVVSIGNYSSYIKDYSRCEIDNLRSDRPTHWSARRTPLVEKLCLPDLRALVVFLSTGRACEGRKPCPFVSVFHLIPIVFPLNLVLEVYTKSCRAN